MEFKEGDTTITWAPEDSQGNRYYPPDAAPQEGEQPPPTYAPESEPEPASEPKLPTEDTGKELVATKALNIVPVDPVEFRPVRDNFPATAVRFDRCVPSTILVAPPDRHFDRARTIGPKLQGSNGKADIQKGMPFFADQERLRNTVKTLSKTYDAQTATECCMKIAESLAQGIPRISQIVMNMKACSEITKSMERFQDNVGLQLK
eukprot:gene28137-34828_t